MGINQTALDLVFQAWRYYYHFDNTWDDHRWDTTMIHVMKNKELITDEKIKWIFNHTEYMSDTSGAPSLFWIKEKEFEKVFS